MNRGLKGGFHQLMQILDLLGMYFDAAVVFVTKSSLLFRFTLAILCLALSVVVQTKKIIDGYESNLK